MPGFWQRLLGRRAPETRAAFDGGFGLGAVTTGNYVSGRMAENLSTVLACVGAISSTLATLPAYVFERTAAGRSEASDHPVSELIRRPNERQSWADWLEMMLAQTLLHGNGISVIEFDGSGKPTALIPIPWQNVQVFILPSGRLAYDIVQFIAPWGGVGTPRRYLDGEVLHLKDRSDDGFLGRSRLSRAPAVVDNAVQIQEYSSSIWRNAATPSGTLNIASKLSPESAARLSAAWQEKNSGSHNAKRTIVLEEGLTFNPMSVSPEDAEVLNSRRFTVEELCRIYQVPPPIVQDYSHGTFTNTAQAALWFAQLTLTPWAKKIEAEFQRVIFGGDDDFHLEVDLSGLMRGDFSARWSAYAIAVQNKILDVNEIREAEGYNPRPDDAAQVQNEPPAAV